ncbi:hypothetical protein [Elizabethkingia anophelis]|uniref:hypothetical protein n=1 Tax=Elizabethkingia anophelis TaxID=1117645 RepID=UPI00372BF46F
MRLHLQSKNRLWQSFFERMGWLLGVKHLYTPDYNKNQLPTDIYEEAGSVRAFLDYKN